MNTLKTIFFGTHEFAVTILDGLVESPFFDVTLVVTQPDKPVGRKKVLTPPPVKVYAEQQGITVAQPPSLKKFDVTTYAPDICIVAQYGKIIPDHILDAAPYKTINVHTSLLPQYRGASPIQSALIHGDTTTGVTIMQMNAGLDTGPIISQRELEILPTETYLELDARLAPLASDLLVETIPQYVSGDLVPVLQVDAEATHCKQFTRDDGKVDWQRDAATIYNQYRGMTPWPGVWTMWGDKRLKLLDIRPSSQHHMPGQVSVENATLHIGTQSGSIVVHKLQLEGKKAMDAQTFLQGFSSSIDGATLG